MLYRFSLYFPRFIRQRSGTVTTFDVPGAIETVSYGIDSAGRTVGYYLLAFAQANVLMGAS